MLIYPKQPSNVHVLDTRWVGSNGSFIPILFKFNNPGLENLKVPNLVIFREGYWPKIEGVGQIGTFISLDSFSMPNLEGTKYVDSFLTVKAYSYFGLDALRNVSHEAYTDDHSVLNEGDTLYGTKFCDLCPGIYLRAGFVYHIATNVKIGYNTLSPDSADNWLLYPTEYRPALKVTFRGDLGNGQHKSAKWIYEIRDSNAPGYYNPYLPLEESYGKLTNRWGQDEEPIEDDTQPEGDTEKGEFTVSFGHSSGES